MRPTIWPRETWKCRDLRKRFGRSNQYTGISYNARERNFCQLRADERLRLVLNSSDLVLLISPSRSLFG